MAAKPAPRPWDEAYRTQGRLWRGARLDPLTRRVLDEAPGARSWRWLDAGCGDGKGLVPLAEALGQGAPAVVGADRSVWGLRLARDALRGAGATRTALLRADARAWPLREGVFDAVRAVHLFGHLVAPDRAVAVAACRDVLRPGGLLLVSEFGTADFRCGQGEVVEPGTYRRGVGIRTHYFERDEIVGLVASAGLDVRSVEPQRFTVDYEGVARARERWDLVAMRP